MSSEPNITAASIRLRFTTREKDLDLDDSAPILIPTSFRRYQLSQYVNSQLNKDKSIPLEFLINGSYLRTTLDEYLTENGVSNETTLNVEYVRAKIPPQYIASLEHDDWVSDIDVLSSSSHAGHSAVGGTHSNQLRILTSSYDGRIRVWDSTSQVLATSAGSKDGGHASFVKSAKFVSPKQVVSASFDRTIRLWKFDESEGTGPVQITPQLELYGHKSGVNSICAHAPSHRLLSASDDHSVGFWSTKKSDAPPAPEALIPRTITKDGKRRKLNPSVSVAQRGPLARMHQHTASVTAAAFDLKDPTVGYSASMDHTVRTWDLVTATLVDTRPTNNALFCLDQLSSLHLLAAGSASRDIKLVDPRDSAANVVAMTLKGHKNFVVALARDPENEYVLASGSHDGTCRIWDVRSTNSSRDGVTGQSMYTIPRESLASKPTPLTGEGVKVFGVCWDTEVGLLSGGEDKSVQINRSDTTT